MELDISIIEKVMWSGIAAAGFAFLFNVPLRLIPTVFLIASVAGFIKFASIMNGAGVIFSSLYGASFIGFASIPVARLKQTSPFVISIPSVICFIPGYFGYETLLGIMRLALMKNSINEIETLIAITRDALNMIFILGGLAIGVSLPWLIFREKGLRKIKLTDEKNLV